MAIHPAPCRQYFADEARRDAHFGGKVFPPYGLAQQRYAQFVSEGIQADSPWQNLKGQVFLGDERFVQQMQAKIEAGQRNDVQIPVAQRRARPLSLPIIERSAPDRNSAIVTAYATGAYSYQEIATHFGIHFTTVGRIVRRGE